MVELDDLFQKIQFCIDKKAHIKADSLFKAAIKDAQSEEILAQVCYEYAFFLFERAEIENCFEMFAKAFNLSFQQQSIKEIIKNTFIDPNITLLNDNYKSHSNNVRLFGKQKELPSLDEILDMYSCVSISGDIMYLCDWNNMSIDKLYMEQRANNYVDMIAADPKYYWSAFKAQEKNIYVVDPNLYRVLCFLTMERNNNNNIYIWDSMEGMEVYLDELDYDQSLPKAILADDLNFKQIDETIDKIFNKRYASINQS